MMKARKLALTILFTAAFAASWAQSSYNAYSFLGVTSSSHVYGMGGHNVSLVGEDINVIEQNPALLGPELEMQVGLNYMRYLGTSNFMGARFGMPINARCAWSAAVEYYGYGSFTATDLAGNVIGTFNAGDIAFSGTFAHDINDRWRAGITAKVLSSHYESYSALALGVDLGVSYYNAERDFAFGVTIKNLGGQVKRFTDEHAALPWDIQMGITKGLGQTPFRLSITVTNMRRWKLNYYTPADPSNPSAGLKENNSFISNLFRHLTFGLEYSPSNKFYLCLGYDHKTKTDMSTYQRNFISGFTLGGGFKVRGFGIGASVAQPHTGGLTLMLNLTTNITELLN